MTRRWWLSPLLSLGSLALVAVTAHAQWSGPLTEPWWGFVDGGSVGGTSGVYRLSGAVGQPQAVALTGGVYRVSAGVWVEPGGGAPTAVETHPLPTVFAFAPLSPNPFSSATTVAFDLPARGRVLGEVYDVRGQRVRTLVDEVRDPGSYRETWDGRTDAGHPLGAGVYFVRVRSSAGEATHRVVRIE